MCVSERVSVCMSECEIVCGVCVCVVCVRCVVCVFVCVWFDIIIVCDF